jgi:PKD domain
VNKAILTFLAFTTLVLFFFCSRKDTLYNPDVAVPARCFARLCDTLIVNPTLADTSRLVKCDTILPDDSIVFIGIVTPANANLRSVRWDFGDGENASTAVAFHTYTVGGLYNGIFTIEDNVGLTLSDTVRVYVGSRQKQFCISAGDIANWVPTQPDCAVYQEVDSLYNYVDGTAIFYVNNGLVSFFHQEFTGQNSANAEVFGMNFYTMAKAIAMYDTMKSQNSTSDTIMLASYTDTTAYIDYYSASMTCTVVAHINEYLMKLQFTGFANAGDAKASIQAFLDTYMSKSR